jgi:hypothetical protein
MLHEQSVRLPYIASVERVDSEDLRPAKQTTSVMTVYRRKDELRSLLFGGPLHKREQSDIVSLGRDLDACLRGIIVLLEEEVGDTEALGQAKLEWERVVELPADSAGIACKRAALLFALHQEPAVREEFAATDRWLVRDLRDRILPMTIPKFVAGMAQNPESLVLMVATLSELWPGEPLGMPTHIEKAVGTADDRGHRESGGAAS